MVDKLLLSDLFQFSTKKARNKFTHKKSKKKVFASFANTETKP